MDIAGCVQLLSAIGKAIRDRREYLGLSQTQLADRCGLHRTYISEVEHGTANATIKSLMLLAGGLDCDLLSLIGSATHQARLPGADLDILLVSSENIEIHLAQRALQARAPGLSLRVCPDDNEALSHLNGDGAHPLPRLIVVDSTLAGCDGKGLLSSIKANQRLDGVAIVVLVSPNEAEDKLVFYQRHANCCVRKPVDPDKYLELIDHLGALWLQEPLPFHDREKSLKSSA